MSRFMDDGYDEDPTPYELRYANYQRALQGKRGQQALRELRDAIRAMPVPRLIEGAVCRTGEAGPEFCAVGLLAFKRRIAKGEEPAAVLEDLEGHEEDSSETAEIGVSVGLSRMLAYDLAYRNDETLANMSPETRAARFLEWLDKNIRAEAIA